MLAWLSKHLYEIFPLKPLGDVNQHWLISSLVYVLLKLILMVLPTNYPISIAVDQM